MVLELPQNARARAFEDGAHLGDGGVPPRQPPQTRTEEPVIKSDGDDGEDETYQHVVYSLRFRFAPANLVRSLSPFTADLGLISAAEVGNSDLG
jgi:hypothetical protein